MRYEWDDQKNTLNKADHRIGFEAMVGFEWNTAVTGIDDREDYGELRETALGFIGERLHFLVYVALDDDGIRAISLRRASNNEKRRYVDERKRQMG
jgi:uncharacterized protein